MEKYNTNFLKGETVCICIFPTDIHFVLFLDQSTFGNQRTKTNKAKEHK